ncbi:hypothetical protein [Chitinophaga sp. XS-30]|uniref:hypothetical protein n=1 Tax=Chitinophaga sp. XS-30 TaxID=2604421 RepID=UPI0011DDF7EB|nr:hypothetical protein [Chitinophaga sp. XS-30]QEH41826.1 hypothetical protein FW415_13430 [Chitinophaga sp. XS-30]
MKRSRKAMIIILVIISIPFLLLLVNYLFSRYYDKTYAVIDEGAVSEHYSIGKINVPGRKFEYHFSSSNPAGGEHDGYLYYDTLHKRAILQTEEYRPSSGDSVSRSVLTHYLRIDADGNVSGQEEEGDSPFANAVVLKNELIPFQKWSDATQKVHLQHFGKRKFNFECLNPFSGMGNPTGGSPCYFWDGYGYYNIVFNNETLKVKIPCESGSIFFPADHAYRTGLYYYERPEDDIAFLVYAKNHAQHQLFMIKRKK